MTWDKHDLYEACVQSPPEMALMLRAIHGNFPTVLGEDFAGTAALSNHWIKTAQDGCAVAVDIDKQTLLRAGTHERLQTVVGDVREVADSVDCLFVGNFSIGYLHSRAELIVYLEHARSRLNEGGIFVCDTYGGQTAFIRGSFDRDIDLSDRTRCKYRWEQRDADPITGMVTNAIHFRVFEENEVVLDIHDAFIYRWRLWSLPELREALLETGFVSTDIYASLPDAVDDEGNAYADPIRDPEWLDDSYIVCVAGRTAKA